MMVQLGLTFSDGWLGGGGVGLLLMTCKNNRDSAVSALECVYEQIYCMCFSHGRVF